MLKLKKNLGQYFNIFKTNLQFFTCSFDKEVAFFLRKKQKNLAA